MKTRGRAVIYELAGIYLLYLSYQLFGNRAASTGGEFGLVIAFIILFVLLGVGFLSAGALIVHRGYKEKQMKA